MRLVPVIAHLSLDDQRYLEFGGTLHALLDRADEVAGLILSDLEDQCIVHLHDHHGGQIDDNELAVYTCWAVSG